MRDNPVACIIISYHPEMERFMSLLRFWPAATMIVDNGHTLHATQMGASTLISQSKNIGFGGGANVGLKKAFEAGAAWAIVCNQDIELTRAGVLKFTEELEHCEPGIVGPEAGELDAKRWTTILLNNENVDYISGSLMAIHRDVWKATGGFFEPYFMYYEDADLSVRAKNAGFGLRAIEIEGFRHGLVKNDNKEKTKEYYLARNHLLFVQRLAPLPVKIHELSRLPKTLIEHYSSGKGQAIEGIADFAQRRFGKKL